jgi:hypothetical protein
MNTNYYKDVDEMLDDYLSGYIRLCDNCPVNNIEHYETGKYTPKPGSCSKPTEICYSLADKIVDIRDSNEAREKGVTLNEIRNKRMHT